MRENLVSAIREKYPAGTRIRLLLMEDPQALPAGSEGTVESVDDVGTIHMRWDCGRSLGLIVGVDEFVAI